MYDVCGQLGKTAKSQTSTMVINDNSLESPGSMQESSPHTCNPCTSKFIVHGAPHAPAQFRAEKPQRREPFARLPKPGSKCPSQDVHLPSAGWSSEPLARLPLFCTEYSIFSRNSNSHRAKGDCFCKSQIWKRLASLATLQWRW